MKKAAFILGYAGGILALVFSLFMIYAVPAKLISATGEEIKNTMNNNDFIAFNEMVLSVQSGSRISSFSEEGFKAFAENVAKNNTVLQTKRVYDETAEFLYNHALGAIISFVLVGVSIIFALVAFIGSLVLRKVPRGGGVMMLIGAFVLLLTSIYTDTILMMAAAPILLTIGGILVFIPSTQKAPKDTRIRQPQFAPGYPQYGAPYPQGTYMQAQYPPQQIQYNYPQPPYQQPSSDNAPCTAAGAPASIEVPFPEEEPRSLSQTEGRPEIKE